MSALLNQIDQYISGLSTAGQLIMTFLISMVPVIELRGAIPIAAHSGLAWYLALPASVLGSLLPMPFILLFSRAVFEWMKKHVKFLRTFVNWLERRAYKKMDSVLRYEILGLCIFVAIPLPGTGAWSGALIATLMNLRLKNAMPSITAGVIIAGTIVTLISYGIISVVGT